MVHKLLRAVVVGLALAATTTLMPATANASAGGATGLDDPIGIMASSRCYVGSSGNCTTAVVGAHAAGHWIYISVNNRLRPSPCPFRVRDVNNGVVIHSGTVGTSGFYSRYLYEVYGYYQVELRGCSVSAQGYISNS
ncbi:MAG TPA: hypothetical protein VF062_04280 [Candidatus Limnocylindrales bacterium]